MSLLVVAANFLQAEEVHFEQNEEEHFIRFQFSGDDTSWMVVFQHLPDSQQVIVLSIAPSLVPEANRASVGEFIHRANFGMLVGNLEIDLDSGEVRFRSSVDIDDLTVDQHMIRNLIFGNIATMNIFISPLHKVLHGGLSAVDALQLIDRVGDA